MPIPPDNNDLWVRVERLESEVGKILAKIETLSQQLRALYYPGFVNYPKAGRRWIHYKSTCTNCGTELYTKLDIEDAKKSTSLPS